MNHRTPRAWCRLTIAIGAIAFLGACDGATNACGGSRVLEARPGDACGTCGTYRCDGTEMVRCEELDPNPCGGCEPLSDAPGTVCGACGAQWMCDGADALDCSPDANPCGGCATLDGEVGAPCGTCDAGHMVCAGTDALRCDEPPVASNACGGCAVLAASPGAGCGPCGLDVYACSGPDDVVCDGSTLCAAGARCDSGDECASGRCERTRCSQEGWIVVEPGTFVMGAPLDEPGRHTLRENGQHTVTFTRPLLAKATTVTQGEWFALMGSRPSYFATCGDDCPVERVSWWEMLAYANELSRAEGLDPCYALVDCSGTVGAGCGAAEQCPGVACAEEPPLDLDCSGYRLPTESEWEYLARAGTTAAFLTASGNLTVWSASPVDPEMDAIAWYLANSAVTYAPAWDCSSLVAGLGPCGTHPVGMKEPNAWGFYDMTGNVWEWTWDWKDTYPDPGSHVIDPTGPPTGTEKAMRGGPFNAAGQYLRVAYRSGPRPHARYYNIGFRLVRSLPPG